MRCYQRGNGLQPSRQAKKSAQPLAFAAKQSNGRRNQNATGQKTPGKENNNGH
jgi:hypothetical protein